MKITKQFAQVRVKGKTVKIVRKATKNQFKKMNKRKL